MSFCSFSYIIYSYKYLESDLIKHCHVIFIHALGQPLIVRSHSKIHAREEIPRKFPREPHVFPIIVTSLDSTENKHGVQRQVRRCRRRRKFIYYIEYFREAADILLLGVWCKNIRYNIPIITLVGVWPDSLSPLEKLSYPRVTLLFSWRQTVGSYSNKGDNYIL
jgi:hypothetical protein